MLLIGKAKLPRGRSYVLRTSLIERALADGGIECDIWLWYSDRDGQILQAFKRPPKEVRPYHHELEFWAGTVSSAERHAAWNSFCAVGVSMLDAWLGAVFSLHEDSTLLYGYPKLSFVWEDGKLRTTSSTKWDGSR